VIMICEGTDACQDFDLNAQVCNHRKPHKFADSCHNTCGIIASGLKNCNIRCCTFEEYILKLTDEYLIKLCLTSQESEVITITRAELRRRNQ